MLGLSNSEKIGTSLFTIVLIVLIAVIVIIGIVALIVTIVLSKHFLLRISIYFIMCNILLPV